MSLTKALLAICDLPEDTDVSSSSSFEPVQLSPKPEAPKPEYVSAYLIGRLRSGHDQTGINRHVVRYGQILGSALCGKKPSGRSVGWSSQFYGGEDVLEATCPKCLKKLEREAEK